MKNRRFCFTIMLLILLVLGSVSLLSYCREMGKLNRLLLAEDTMDRLRAQEVSLEILEEFRKWAQDGRGQTDYTFYDYLCGYVMTGEEERSLLENYIEMLMAYKNEQYREFSGYLTAVWEDLAYFPIPLSRNNQELSVSFSDSWMFERTFGGKRGHEGTDVMASVNERGRYPVLSMSDGVVEQIGWLTKGGYRIGIRSPHGGYFYYAHLYDYAKEFQIGEPVKAGELLGFMGDSGYSEIEGTVGNFDVHLHVGIYVNEPDGTEMSINAFWPLKFLEERKLTYPFY